MVRNYISVISEMELLSYKGLSRMESKKIKAFLKEFTIVNIVEQIKIKAIDIKMKSNLKLPDSIIAATAAFLKPPLITSDKQFKTLKD